MAMGTCKDREEQEELWVPHTALPKGASHPFYQRLNQLLEESHFDEFVEGRCQRFYAKKRGRPSLVPGVYFRLLLIGYFEGIDSERGMAWRANDSLALRRFLRVGLEESPPDHSTISRTRRLIDVETHGEVTAEGGDAGDRRHHAGGERGAADDCAAGHGRRISGVSEAAGTGVRDQD